MCTLLGVRARDAAAQEMVNTALSQPIAELCKLDGQDASRYLSAENADLAQTVDMWARSTITLTEDIRLRIKYWQDAYAEVSSFLETVDEP